MVVKVQGLLFPAWIKNQRCWLVRAPIAGRSFPLSLLYLVCSGLLIVTTIICMKELSALPQTDNNDGACSRLVVNVVLPTFLLCSSHRLRRCRTSACRSFKPFASHHHSLHHLRFHWKPLYTDVLSVFIRDPELIPLRHTSLYSWIEQSASTSLVMPIPRSGLHRQHSHGMF